MRTNGGKWPRLIIGLGALAMVGVNLRLALAVISPLIPDIRIDYDLSTSGAGLAMTVAVLMFGVFAPLAPRWIVRFGADQVVGAGLALIIIGVLVRSAPAPIFLYAGMLVLGSGIAVMNVVLPVIVKRDFASIATLATSVYTASLNIGSATAAAGAVPLAMVLGGWRPAIIVAIVPAIAALLLWWWWAPRKKAVVTDPIRQRSLLRDPVALQVTAYMLLQSLLYYSLLAWLPTIYADHGESTVNAGFLLAVAQIAQLVACLLVPVLIRGMKDQRLAAAGFAMVTAVAFLGLAVAPVGAPVLWAVLLGLGQGGALTMALLLIVVRSPTPSAAAGLSGMAQGAGYLVAALGPVAVGALYDALGEWTTVLILLTGLCMVEVWVGMLAGRRRLIKTSGQVEKIEREEAR